MTYREQDYRNFGRYGKKNQANPRVVSLLQHGYHLDLKLLPKLSKILLILSEYHNKNKDSALYKAVQAMITKEIARVKRAF